MKMVPSNTGPALYSLDEFLAQSYNYVVIGGDIVGLVIAARLTENPSVTVGVIEAGQNRMDNKRISTPCLYPSLNGRPEYDWCMTSTPQSGAGGKTYSMPRGKELGNKGGGWDDLVLYFRKHQTLDIPDAADLPEDKQFMPYATREKYHENDGPIHTSFNDYYMPLEKNFCKAAYDVGGKPSGLSDAWCGDHMGFYSSLGVVDRSSDAGNSSYAATGYLRPNLHRKNLRVLTEAHATRILLVGDRAVGVEFAHSGKKHSVKARKEVVLSAGTIQTPQLLKLSGIGDPEVLKKADVQCNIENKWVEANFQDHVLGGMLFDCKHGVLSLDALHSEEYAQAQQEIYDKTHDGPYGSPGMLMGFVSYASLAGESGVTETIKAIQANSLAKTKFEKAQEKVIVCSRSCWNELKLGR
jgi:choline dehydrogenase-like flavoprotein